MDFGWDEEWLARRAEAPIDAARTIVDPHHHLWDSPHLPRYVVADLDADTGSGHNIIGTVLNDCLWHYRTDGPEHLRPVGETEAVAAWAEASGRDVSPRRAGGADAGASRPPILGVVSFADMTLGDAVEEVLDAHLAVGRGLFKGVRHATAIVADRRIQRAHTRPRPGVMGEPAFRRGVTRLAAKGLAFDAWVYHPQLAEVTALARAVPSCVIVLDHIGTPLGIGPYAGHLDEALSDCRRDLGELAACENVVVKVGGIGMPSCGLGLDQRPLPPTSDELVAIWGSYLRFVIERFGPDRCMFESNFPVDKTSVSYVTLWNTFQKIAAPLTEPEQDALFRGTANRVYALGL